MCAANFQRIVNTSSVKIVRLDYVIKADLRDYKLRLRFSSIVNYRVLYWSRELENFNKLVCYRGKINLLEYLLRLEGLANLSKNHFTLL